MKNQNYKPPEWVAQYIDIPFEKYNCWQLVCKVYAEQFDIKLPNLDAEYFNALDAANIKKLYERELPRTWVKQDYPITGDCIVMSIKSQPWHVGIIVSRNQMLHTERHMNSVVERFTGPQWKNNIIGFYRYTGK